METLDTSESQEELATAGTFNLNAPKSRGRKRKDAAPPPEGESQQELAPFDANTLPANPLGPYGTTTALALPENLEWDDWTQVCARIQQIGVAGLWWAGDALVYGSRKYGEKFAQIVDHLGYARQSLKNAMFVCGRIPPERRHPGLTFSHHSEVASLSDKEQAKWLKWAETESAPIAALREAIRAAGHRKAGAGDEPQERKEDNPLVVTETFFAKLESLGKGMDELNLAIAALRADFDDKDGKGFDWERFDAVFNMLGPTRDVFVELVQHAMTISGYRQP